ncbi:MalY/PatB family protein [Alkalihalobacillus pseudalcaliphilus]|uniref:MalY/PatB family protein n=1 Tax=Alkalihalobacillus pseudalcaliphilus TaxID=79884 RepID=UPI00064E0C77|nr:MalY/PatB family protein [Alkalihalobacillus pseudalcaliphilus]KMK77770.1 cystathionine beta-lyase [Alkalihalobacillus pseudalcaliphilus]
MSERFNQVIERKGTNSLKWDMLQERFGSDDVLPLWVADMDFRAPDAVIEAIKEKADHGIFGYPAHAKSLDKAVQSWLKRRYGWEVQENAFIYTLGVVPALSHLICTFTKKSDEIIIQSPVYYPFYDVIEKNERTLVKNPLKYNGQRYEMDYEDLESKITDHTKMLLLCHPHNPGGRVWEKAELERLVAICKKHNLYIVSDEIHADLLYDGFTHTPIASIDLEMSNRIFTCLAPSKTFNLAGMQASYVVIEDAAKRLEFKKYMATTFTGMNNSFAEVAMEAAYTYGEPWLEELMTYIQHNYQLVTTFITEHMPKIKWMEPEGTYLLWLDFTGLNMDPVERKKWLIEEAKVGFNHGAMFGEEGSNFERMNLACPSSIVEEALTRLKRAYDNIS